MILISACLAGINTRYDGTNCGKKRFKDLVAEGKAIPICPEQLGGLPTPREPVELLGGDGDALLNNDSRAIGRKSGDDYTHNFLRGANEILKLAHMLKIEKAILKDGSPSCGSTYIKIKGKKAKGIGVTAAALIAAGIEVESDEINKPAKQK